MYDVMLERKQPWPLGQVRELPYAAINTVMHFNVSNLLNWVGKWPLDGGTF